MEQIDMKTSDVIYGIMVTRNALDALRGARRFFQQTYSPKTLLVVTASNDTYAFRHVLQPWINRKELEILFLPSDTSLGSLRQAGMERVPMYSVYVAWDDDDIRHEDLLLHQYREMESKPSAAVVSLNAQIVHDLSRNASVVASGQGPIPSDPEQKTWHGITGSIMGIRLPTTPTYKSVPRTEDSLFLKAILDEDKSAVHVFDNRPGW